MAEVELPLVLGSTALHSRSRFCFVVIDVSNVLLSVISTKASHTGTTLHSLNKIFWWLRSH